WGARRLACARGAGGWQGGAAATARPVASIWAQGPPGGRRLSTSLLLAALLARLVAAGPRTPPEPRPRSASARVADQVGPVGPGSPTPPLPTRPVAPRSVGPRVGTSAAPLAAVADGAWSPGGWLAGRLGPTAVWDAAQSRLLVFGGYDGTN